MGCNYHHFVLKKDVESKKAFSTSKVEVDFDYVMLCCVESHLDVIKYSIDEFCKNDIDSIVGEFSKFSFVSNEDYIYSFDTSSRKQGIPFPKSCKADAMKWFALEVKSSLGNDCSKDIKKTIKLIKNKCIEAFKDLGIENEIFYDADGRANDIAGKNSEDAFFAFAITC